MYIKNSFLGFINNTKYDTTFFISYFSIQILWTLANNILASIQAASTWNQERITHLCWVIVTILDKKKREL